MNTTKFIIFPDLIDIEKLIYLASEPCERYTGSSICSDDPSLSYDAKYGADLYCPPCRIRAAVAHLPIKPVASPKQN